METKSEHIRQLEGQKSQLEMRKLGLEVELGRVGAQIKAVDLQIKQIRSTQPAFVRDKQIVSSSRAKY